MPEHSLNNEAIESIAYSLCLVTEEYRKLNVHDTNRFANNLGDVIREAKRLCDAVEREDAE